ncbi:MAG: cytochrome D1 domain-containing protein [Terriglobales bacterium]
MRWSLPLLALSVLGILSFCAVTANAASGWLLVANKGDNAMGIIDPVAAKQVAEVAEGGVTGHEIVTSPDGKLAYVPIYGDSGVGMPGTDGSNMVVIDLASRKVVGNLDFGKGVRPHLPKFGPRNGLLYVSTELDRSISIVDPASLKIIGSVPTGQEQSHMFAITRDGRRAYTANVGPGTVSVLDLEARKTIAIIPVSGQVQRISLSVDDKLVFTSDVTKPQLAVIDTATNKVKTWIPLPGLGYGSATTADGRWLLIALPLVHQLAVIDLSAMKVAHTIDLPTRPQEVLVSPDQKMAYVSCDQSGKVAAISLGDWKVTSLIDAGKGADGLAWATAQ